MLNNHGNALLLLVITLFIIVGFLSGILFLGYSNSPKQEQCVSANFSDKTVIMYLPAVDSQGNGIAGRLETNVMPGTGKVLVNINNILSQYDTQLSGRVAANYAGKYTGINMSTVDVIYSIKADADIIEGTSAGASMAVSVISALTNKPVRNDVAMTGTANENGIIGSVGAIHEKAYVAKGLNMTLFLVPPGQASQSVTSRIRKCQSIGMVNYCKISYAEQKTNLTETIDINIIEVETIEQALKYYLANP